jgi:transposase
VYQQLGIGTYLAEHDQDRKYKYALDDAMKLLVFGRILAPQSKSSTVVNFQTKLWGDLRLTQNQIDRSLDRLNRVKEDLQTLIHRKIADTVGGRNATLVFYDVTNYYFEVDVDDDFRRRGCSKEHRPKPIVQMGLFMDSNNIPIAYKLFTGNCVDVSTYLPAIKQVKQQFGIERIVIVADKAMNSKDNVSQTSSNNDGWLFSQKFRGKTGSPKDIQDFMLDQNGWEYNQTMTFAKKSMIRTRKLNGKEEVREKVLVTWRESYAKRERIRRDGAVSFANNLRDPEKYRQTMRRGGKKYLRMRLKDTKTGKLVLAHPLLDIDQELVDFDAQFDGMNVIVTSETTMDDEAMMKAYTELNRIEDCFRITKTHLKTRPVFVWTREHIEAHFLTCFVALVILRLLQHKINYQLSAGRIIDGMNSLTARHAAKDYYETDANEDGMTLLELLGIDWSDRYQSIEKIERLRRLDVAGR